jgi:hypothetical protein
VEAVQILVGSVLTIIAAATGYRYGSRYPLRRTRRRNVPGEYRGYAVVLLQLVLAMQFLHVQLGWLLISPMPFVFGAIWLGARHPADEPSAPIAT